MTRNLILALLTAVSMAACGADGEPVQPTMNLGVGVGSSGVNGWGSVGLHQGPVSLYLGF
jgi:hypothetical protein